MNREFVNLYREYGSHQWSNDPNTMAVLIRCLLNANIKDVYFCGQLIRAGSFATSLSLLSKQCGVSIRSVRTALNRLVDDAIIEIISERKYTIINVLNHNNKNVDICKKYCEQKNIKKRKRVIIDDLYLILNTFDNTVKIGRSKNPHLRLKQLQTCTSHKLNLLYVINGMGCMEKELHNLFSGIQLSGEWFKNDGTIIKYFEEELS